MRVPLFTMISTFGVPAILLLYWMTVAANDSFKSDWRSGKHPRVSVSSDEHDYMNRVLVPHKSGGMGAGRPCIRKEYRCLSDTERQTLATAFNKLKTTPVDRKKKNGPSQYDILVGYHRFETAPEAHYGPAFLPFHREYLCRLERALQLRDSSVCLPYLDWTLDEGIPVPSDSAIWTSKYLGNNDGRVTSGLAANWKAYPADCASPWPYLQRSMVQGKDAKDFLFKDADINATLSQTRYEELCTPYNSLFENDHNSVHVCIGGHMNILSCSPNDPMFFFHHAFIDCIWYKFRKDYQKTNLETDYPKDSRVPDDHRFNDTMKPFENLTNINGLSKNYTSKLYICQERAKECKQHKDCCNSVLLWCDNGRCRAKIREGGKCDNLNSAACYSENCINPTCNSTCKCPEVKSG